MSIVNFRFPTDIKFGPNSIDMVPELLKAHKVESPLVVTDQQLREISFFKKFEKNLVDNGISIEVYSEPKGNPVKNHVLRGVARYKQANADAVVSIGGGCALDVGKAIALMASHPGDLFDYEDGKKGAREVNDRIPFTLSIPTTAGTGSEVGGSSVISDDDSHQKVIIWSTYLVPKVVVADPMLLVGLPASVTAATGIDALTHNVEAYLAKNYHPMCEGIALEGIRTVFENLELSVKEPENITARSGMLMASMMGAVAFQKGLGVTHSCAHALSTCFDIHHGLANALMLPTCLKFNDDAVAKKLTHVLRMLEPQQTQGLDFTAKVEGLIKTVGLTQTLRDLGVSLSDKLVDTAYNDPCHENNPKTCSRNDFKEIFIKAIAS